MEGRDEHDSGETEAWRDVGSLLPQEESCLEGKVLWDRLEGKQD